MRKKIIFFAVAASLSVFLLGSCKSSSHCPAYSHADIEQTNQNV